MAIVDKTKQRFDENIKADKVGLLNAFIHASYKLDEYIIKDKKYNHINKKEKFVLRLIPLLEIYRIFGRGEAFVGEYSEMLHFLDANDKENILNEKSINKRLGSMKTAGGEVGIWTDANFTLSPLAVKVAENKITIRKYLSVVFLNLFSFFKEDKLSEKYVYKHILKEVLIYFDKNGCNQTYDAEILTDIFKFSEDNDRKLGNQRNILFDYLTSTEFFEAININGSQKKEFYMNPFWRDNIKKLIGICNLEYQDFTIDEVEKELNRNNTETTERYGHYVGKNYDKLCQLEKDIIANKFEEEVKTEEVVELEEESSTSEFKGRGTNIIYFGAPGTGKSYNIQNYIRSNGLEDYRHDSECSNVFRTTLHPEFDYSDFVGQILPVDSEEHGESVIKYEFVPGIFVRSLEKAMAERKKGKPVFLILEEMSRANVAAVFGDLFQLLDRDESGESEYCIDNSLITKYIYGENSKKRVFIPSNFYIIGTVNTSDQNVFVLDTAFKRRFEFIYLSTKVVNRELNDYHFTLTADGNEIEIQWTVFIEELNKFIVTAEEKDGLGLSEDKQLGQFFIKFRRDDNDYNYDQIKGKLIQYLWFDIENISYSKNKLFSEDILSFSDLYEKSERKENFFSDEFLKRIVKEW